MQSQSFSCAKFKVDQAISCCQIIRDAIKFEFELTTNFQRFQQIRISMNVLSKFVEKSFFYN